jgi:hypothetical protein
MMNLQEFPRFAAVAAWTRVRAAMAVPFEDPALGLIGNVIARGSPD